MGPFVLLFLLIVSRIGAFDRWDWFVSLVVVLGLHSLWAILSAVLLKRALTRARGTVIERLEKERLESEARRQTERVDFLDHLLDRVRRLNTGAFAPMSRQPIVGAVLMPFGGVGGLMLIEMLTSWS